MKDNRAIIWSRVSTTRQDTQNQVRQLREWGGRRGLDIVDVYQVEESAWKGSHQRALSQLMDDARKGRFDVLLVWSLDRLSRQGPLPTLEIMHSLGRHGVQIFSYMEQWTEATGELRDLLISIVGWVAKMESNRRSERTKAGLARAVASGRKLGRPVGSKDKAKRRRRGYFARYAR